MEDIQIAGTLSEKRREKGITQEELALYIGVSKASVSKWETGQSYPDISILPRLAAYFNITVDELIGYQPQLGKDEIRRLYHQLASEFVEHPLDQMLEKCREIIRRYYSCFPLLVNMANLLSNHVQLAETKEKQMEIFLEIRTLCQRVKAECRDFWLIRQANLLQAVNDLSLGEPESARELLEGTVMPDLGEEIVLASAYKMLKKEDKAIETLQINLYQNLVQIVSDAQLYLMLHGEEPVRFEEIVKRIRSLVDTFHMEKLHPMATGNFYYGAALMYARQGKPGRAMDLLERFVNVWAECQFPVILHGDEFFDSLEPWFSAFDLGEKPPIGEKSIKKALLLSLTDEPAFQEYKKDSRYQKLLQKFQDKLVE